MKKENVIKTKSFQFAIKIVELYKILTVSKREFVMSKQLLKSGTSIGANVRESEHAESKADFIHKLSIALKEANETEYWLDLLKQTEYLENSDYLALKNDIKELLKILISIIKSSKNNNC
ncbi:four helix bundle protein [Psychroserpens sp. S379A]|uniref:four helix bundle protein n=1 Tax=Psychroserpens sp. S379A TaxID=3415137 RepID=UPI003C7E47D9